MPDASRLATRSAPTAMVCTVDHLASNAGLRMIAMGGTAADAAVAASAVLAVTAPHLCGIGGDLWALVHEGAGPPLALNASGRAGSGADPQRLREEGFGVMPYQGDIRSVPVPGCVDGWMALHGAFGRLEMRDVLAPAISYARDGFPASPLLAAALPFLEGVESSGEIEAPARVRSGDLLRRSTLARTLDAIAAAGRKGFYEGHFGEALVEIGAGEYSQRDLESPLADWVDPVSSAAWEHEIWTTPPNSQGYIIPAAAWMAAHLPLPEDPACEEWPHLLVEAATQASFDRPEVLHESADGFALVAEERLRSRLAAIDPERASDATAPASAGDTTYLCAVDGQGLAVSLIQSNASGFGANIVVPGTGVLLHNRGIGFSLREGHPAEYGPRRRPPSTLSPVLVTRPDGTLRAVAGTMGGDAQPQIVLQVLARLLASGESPGRAIGSPRWMLARPNGHGFETWREPLEVEVRVEADAPSGWVAGLARRGHRVGTLDALSSAAGHAHLIDAGGDVLRAAADPRALVGSAAGM